MKIAVSKKGCKAVSPRPAVRFNFGTCNLQSSENRQSMLDIENTVAAIECKIRQMMEENDRLRHVEADLAARCGELQEQVNNQNITINNLKEQNKILKLGNTLTQKGDSVELKLKINQLVRSIDHALASIDKSE